MWRRRLIDGDMLQMPDNFNLSRPLEMMYPWIQSARLMDGSNRQAIVNHAEGTNLHISLQVTGEGDGHRLVFFHNASRVDDFTGSIIVDSRSNRYVFLILSNFASFFTPSLFSHPDLSFPFFTFSMLSIFRKTNYSQPSLTASYSP